MIFIYNRDEKQIAHLDIIPKITEEIGKLRVLEFESEQEFEKGYRVVAKTNDGVFEFIIVDSDYSRDDIKIFSYFCQDSLIENESVPILDKRPTGDISTALTPVFSDTRWIFEIRSTDTINQNYSNSFYHMSALEAFADTVEKYKVEWITEFKYAGSKITERRVVIYRRDGRSKGRLEFGKNIKKFSRKILSEPIITALYPYGKGEDLGNGAYGRRIGIESVNNGIPYIENKQATELYGIGEKGSKKPLFAFITFEEETDSTKLKIEAQKELDILSQIRAEYTVDAINIDIEAKIGYEVAVIDEEIGYRGFSRIIKIARQGDDVELTFGTVTKKFVDSVQKTLKKNERNINDAFIEINNVRTSADGKTRVFTGPSQPENASNGDMWYRENPNGTVDILIFRDGQWIEHISDKVFKALKQDLEENTRIIEEAKSKSEEQSKRLDELQKSHEARLQEFQNNLEAIDIDGLATEVTQLKESNSQALNDFRDSLAENSNDIKLFRQTVSDIRGEYTQAIQTARGIESTVSDNVTRSVTTQLSNLYSTRISNIESKADSNSTNLSSQNKRLTSVETSLDGFNLTISNLDDKVTSFSATLSGVETRVKSSVTESVTTQLSDIYDRKISEAKSSLEIQLSIVRQTAWGLQTKVVGTDGLESQVTQLKNQITSKVSRPDVESIISQQSDNIWLGIKDRIPNSKMSGGEILSSLNLDRSGVRIKGSLITLDGSTYITNGVIQTAHIKDASITNAKIASIRAEKISAGTIDFNKIRGINIDANNISTGTISSGIFRTSFNNVNNIVTIDGSGMTVDGNWGGKILFNNRGLTFIDKLANLEMGSIYGLYRIDSDPLRHTKMGSLGVFATYGYGLALGLRNVKEDTFYTFQYMTMDGPTHVIRTYANVEFHHDMKFYGGSITGLNNLQMSGRLTGATNAGYEFNQGTNGAYIRFNNGLKICWHKMGYKARSNGWEGWKFPITFDNPPTVTASLYRGQMIKGVSQLFQHMLLILQLAILI